MNEATERNIRVQNRYDELMAIGKHGHYETMFQVVREETESLRQQLAEREKQVLCEKEPIAWKYEQEHFDSMGGISTEYMSHKIECVGRSHWVPLYAATKEH